MMRLVVHAVLEDIHPRALVEVDGEYHCVDRTHVTPGPATLLSQSRFRAALTKHGYSPLEPPLSLDSEQQLREFLDSRVVDPEALLEGLP